METINGYENYEIDIWGNVWSKKRKKFLIPAVSKHGYFVVQLCKDGRPKHFLIHRLVAIQFIENPDNLDFVDHIDRNKLNNDLENLRWVTRSQNNRNKECKGYNWHKQTKKWRAQYTLNNKKIHIGSFEKEEEARNAYLNAIKDL